MMARFYAYLDKVFDLADELYASLAAAQYRRACGVPLLA